MGLIVLQVQSGASVPISQDVSMASISTREISTPSMSEACHLENGFGKPFAGHLECAEIASTSAMSLKLNARSMRNIQGSALVARRI
jgi:hypothetical protein